MNGNIKMGEIGWAKAVLFGSVDVARTRMDAHKEWGFLANINRWRWTFGGKLMGVLDLTVCLTLRDGKYIPIARMQYPLIPLLRPSLPLCEDVWATGTAWRWMMEAAEVLDDQSFMRRLRSERNPRSKKLAHRVVYCDRTHDRFITDPLMRQTFATLDEAVEFLEKRKQARKERYWNGVAQWVRGGCLVSATEKAPA